MGVRLSVEIDHETAEAIGRDHVVADLNLFDPIVLHLNGDRRRSELKLEQLEVE